MYIVNIAKKGIYGNKHITNYTHLIRGIATDLRKRYKVTEDYKIIIIHTCFKKSRKYPNGYRTQFRKVFVGSLEELKEFSCKFNNKRNPSYTKRKDQKRWFWDKKWKKKVLAAGIIYDPKTKEYVKR